MVETLPPRLRGAEILTFGSLWLDELPEGDAFLARLKRDNAAPKNLRAALLCWSDGSMAKVSGWWPAPDGRLQLDPEGVQHAYLLGRTALERKYREAQV